MDMVSAYRIVVVIDCLLCEAFSEPLKCLVEFHLRVTLSGVQQYWDL